jgi:phosphopentomutase
LPNDLVIITADHGNDPTFEGTDHTREQGSALSSCTTEKICDLGIRETFADVPRRWLHIFPYPGRPERLS